MIKVRGKTGEQGPNTKIIFEPRQGFKKRVKTLEFPLLYGHVCPNCSNVMQALFKAPRAFELWPYEETVLLSQGEKNAGELRKVYPDEKTKQGRSCYRMDYDPAEGGSVKLTLKNHVIRHAAVLKEFNGDGLWEVGERPCIKAGIFSLREDLLVKDFLLFSGMTEIEIVRYNIPKVATLIPETNTDFRVIQAVGVAPPIILLERSILIYGYHYKTRGMITPYAKKTA